MKAKTAGPDIRDNVTFRHSAPVSSLPAGHPATTRRHPPYAKAARAALAAHAGPLTGADLRLFTGQHAWRYAAHRHQWRPHQPTLCLPPTESPHGYRWACVRGTEPWVITTGGLPDQVLRALALELLSAGAGVVRISFLDGSKRAMAVFRREVGNG